MAAELYIKFENKKWLHNKKEEVKNQIRQLNTFIKQVDDEFWLKGIESKDNPYFDTRFILDYDDFIFLEITFHPPSIELSLNDFLDWLRDKTTIKIEDEDGELSNW